MASMIAARIQYLATEFDAFADHLGMGGTLSPQGWDEYYALRDELDSLEAPDAWTATPEATPEDDTIPF